MQLSLSKSAVLPMMVTHLLASVEPDAFISISIALGCTFINVCIFVDGYIPTSSIFSSSTPSSSSDFSMFIGSIDVALGPTYTLELQPLLRLCKNSIIDVLVLYMS